MHPLVLVLTWVVVVEGGVQSRDCPAGCRCEDVGIMQRVYCVDVGLKSVPSNLSGFTSSLDVSMNDLQELSPHVFTHLYRLIELRMAGNHLTEIRRDTFTGLVSLKLLTLQNNHIKTVPSGAFENLMNLRSLHLDANSISHLWASSFRGLPSLRHLWLDDNVLMEVPVLALRTLTELQALTLALNNISSIPDRAFSSLSQLLVLHLHNNRIHFVDRRGFDGLNNLQTLDLSFNRINCLPAAIKHLSSLRDLNLKNNDIPVVTENAFSGNPSIEIINIQNNPLHTVGHSSFKLQPELRTLYLSGSSITDFPDLNGSIKLETLSITYSRISTLPNICEQLPNLHILDLSHNLIHSLPSFSSCRKIHTIDLSSNRLSSVSLRSVTHLKLRVHDQHLHGLRESELRFVPRCETFPRSGSSTCGLDWWCLRLLHLSVSFILMLLLLSSAPRPSSRRFLTLLLWFWLLAALSWSSIISLDCFCGWSLDIDPQSAVSFLCLSSELCVFMVVMLVVYRNRTWTRSCTQISFTLTLYYLLMVTPEITLCSSCFLLNHSCLLFVLTRRCRRQKEVTLSQRGVSV